MLVLAVLGIVAMGLAAIGVLILAHAVADRVDKLMKKEQKL